MVPKLWEARDRVVEGPRTRTHTHDTVCAVVWKEGGVVTGSFWWWTVMKLWREATVRNSSVAL